MNKRQHLRALSTGLVLSLTFVTAAEAKTCSDQSITGRGEPSRFVWLAKTKARASWRYKVRGTPALGAPYANWARAENTEERCLTGPLGTLCIFTGNPCLP